MSHPPNLLSDLSLARRLERAEARASADFVDGRARAFPGAGAAWIDLHIGLDRDGITAALLDTGVVGAAD